MKPEVRRNKKKKKKKNIKIKLLCSHAHVSNHQKNIHVSNHQKNDVMML
jgi:hypothetical protein